MGALPRRGPRATAHPAFAGHLAFEHDEPHRPPQIDERAVRFNGIGRNGYERFLLASAAGCEGRGWCKTAFAVNGEFKVYDLAVCATLIAAHKHLRAEVSSDGDWFSPGSTSATASTRESGSPPSTR